MITLLAAALVATALPPVPAPADPAWAFVSSSGDLKTQLLVHSVDSPSGPNVRRLWVRFAYETDQFGKTNVAAAQDAPSQVLLVEVDCVGDRTRTLQTSRYSDTNLGRLLSQTGEADPAWEPIAPESFAQEIHPIACRAGNDPTLDIMLMVGPQTSASQAAPQVSQ
ncbi:MAG: surface-adhesin E family protein [Caulobacteraceae bacterium]